MSNRLVSSFSNLGFEPTVYTEDLSKTKDKLEYWASMENLKYEVVSFPSFYLKSKIFRKIVRLFPIFNFDISNMPTPSSFPFWNLPLCFKFYFNRALIQNKFDFIFSISTPVSDHISGLFLKKLTKLPWISYFSDPWLRNPYRYGKVNKVQKYFHKKVVEKSDALIYNTKEIRDLELEFYPEYKEKSFVIPQSYYSGIDEIKENRNLNSERTVFRYVGEFYGIRTPESLLSAISMAKKKEKGIEKCFQFEFIGRPFSKLNEMKQKYGITSEVIEMPLVSYLDSLSYMKGADVLVHMDANLEINYFIASKLVEYVGCKKPILGITSQTGTAADLIREANGFVVGHDPEKIADAIINIVRMKRSNELVAHCPSEELRSRYSIETIAKKYAEIFLKNLR